MTRKDSKGRNLQRGESQRSDGRYYYQTTVDGIRHTVYSWTLVPTDRTPAGKKGGLSLREKEAELRREIEKRTISLGNETLEAVLDAYIPHLESQGRLRAMTMDNYRKWAKIWKSHPIAKKKVRRIRPCDVDAACWDISHSRRLKRSTMSRILVVARLAVLWYYKQQDVTAENPFSQPLEQGCGESSDPRAALSVTELTEVIDAFREGFGETNATYLMVKFLSQSGLRLGEARGLLISDIDLEGRRLHVCRQLLPGLKVGPPKTESGDRYVPITDDLEQTILEIMARRRPAVEHPIEDLVGFLFVTKFGKPYSQTSFSNDIYKFCRSRPDLASGKHISPHILRHTYATHLIQAGVSPSAVQYVLGHSSLQPTLGTYVHSDREFAMSEIQAKKAAPEAKEPI